jgi:eukaryotic-like serine/threonine-protein kinase
MGVIYKGHHIQHKTDVVAIKVLHDDLLSEVNRKRFLRESEIVDKLEHPNIIRIYERGEDKQRCYIVMEYLAGQTLTQVLEKNGRLSPAEAVAIVAQVAGALVRIHGLGVVHRDLKPENIMLVEKEGNPLFVTLLDFGIAKAAWETRCLTMTGEIMGTAQYMAPEQLFPDGSLAPACDIFSLGTIFYELVSGQKPWSSLASEAALEIAQCTPRQPIELDGTLPAGLNQLIMQMLAKDPLDRPGAQDVADRLRDMPTA